MSSVSLIALPPAEIAVVLERNLSQAALAYLSWRLIPAELADDWHVFASRYGGKPLLCRPEVHAEGSSVVPDQIFVFSDGSITHESNWTFDIYDSERKFHQSWDWGKVVDDGSAVSRYGLIKGWVRPSEDDEYET